MRSGDASTQFRLRLRRLERGFERALRRYAPLLGLGVAGALSLWAGVAIHQRRPEVVSREPGRMEVSVLNVGQGEASFVRTPEGRFIVIGTGPQSESGRLIAALHAAGARSIDLLCVPYYDDDAIGGAIDLMNAFPVAEAIEPAGPVVNRLQDQFRTSCVQHRVKDNEVHVRQVARIKLSDTANLFSEVRVDIDAPDTEPMEPLPSAASNSLVLRVRYRKTAFLFAGGLDHAGEDVLLSNTPDLSANWLRVAHFGAADATSNEFLRLVSPDYAVISVGPNPDGDPAPETLNRLQAAGAEVFRTDSTPNILSFTSDGVQVQGPRRQ